MNRADDKQGQGVEPDATVFPRGSLTILQFAAPTQSTVAEPDTAAPTWSTPLGNSQVTWQPPAVEDVAFVVETTVATEVLPEVTAELVVAVPKITELVVVDTDEVVTTLVLVDEDAELVVDEVDAAAVDPTVVVTPVKVTLRVMVGVEVPVRVEDDEVAVVVSETVGGPEANPLEA